MQTRKLRSQTRRLNSGFTVVEIAIVLLISGFIYAIFLSGYRSYVYNKDYNETIIVMGKIDKALIGYYSAYGRYPCPADPTLAPGHDDYGVALPCGAGAGITMQCNSGTGAGPRLSDGPGGNHLGGTRSQVICQNTGTRDVDGDGNDEYALIGILPFVTMALDLEDVTRFAQNSTIDGYDMRITYAVTEIQANVALDVNSPANPHAGAISIFDENGTNMSDPPSSVHYMLLSHGANKMGAYTIDGIRTDNCITGFGVLPPGLNDPTNPMFGGAINLENENCDDNDGVFRNALKSLSTGPEYFDDIIFNRNIIPTNLWNQAPNTPSVPAGLAYLYNTNLANVGVGIDTPTSKLHVAGDVRAERQTYSEEGYCDPSRPLMDQTSLAGAADGLSECLQTEFIAGTETQCPDGQVAIGFEFNTLICEDIFLPSLNYDVTCGLDGLGRQLFATGIRYNRATNTISPLSCELP